MVTPVSQKLNATKKKHFAKYADPMAHRSAHAGLIAVRRGVAKPMPSLFSQQESTGSDSDSEDAPRPNAQPSTDDKVAEDENPF